LQIISWLYETLALNPLPWFLPRTLGRVRTKIPAVSTFNSLICQAEEAQPCLSSREFPRWNALRLRETVPLSSENPARCAEEQSEDNFMAATTTTGFSIPASAPAVTTARVHPGRRRHITPQAGRALEILAHAIEYLTDEFVHQGSSFSSKNEQLEAVQMLMALNREIYFACPEVPTFGERVRALLRVHEA
jgi:hypothetical protein